MKNYTTDEIKEMLKDWKYNPDNVVHGYDGIFPTTYFKDSGILIYDYPDEIHFKNNMDETETYNRKEILKSLENIRNK